VPPLIRIAKSGDAVIRDPLKKFSVRQVVFKFLDRAPEMERETKSELPLKVAL